MLLLLVTSLAIRLFLSWARFRIFSDAHCNYLCFASHDDKMFQNPPQNDLSSELRSIE
jgi:hypothetical protein